jgi:hypothetical protein
MYNKKIMELQCLCIFFCPDAKYVSIIFFKFVPAGKYLRKVGKWLYCVCIC